MPISEYLENKGELTSTVIFATTQAERPSTPFILDPNPKGRQRGINRIRESRADEEIDRRIGEDPGQTQVLVGN